MGGISEGYLSRAKCERASERDFIFVSQTGRGSEGARDRGCWRENVGGRKYLHFSLISLQEEDTS